MERVSRDETPATIAMASRVASVIWAFALFPYRLGTHPDRADDAGLPSGARRNIAGWKGR